MLKANSTWIQARFFFKRLNAKPLDLIAKQIWQRGRASDIVRLFTLLCFRWKPRQKLKWDEAVPVVERVLDPDLKMLQQNRTRITPSVRYPPFNTSSSFRHSKHTITPDSNDMIVDSSIYNNFLFRCHARIWVERQFIPKVSNWMRI